MIEGASLLRIRKYVAAPVVFNRYVALFNVDVGSAVLPHRSQFYQMALGLELSQSEQQI